MTKESSKATEKTEERKVVGNDQLGALLTLPMDILFEVSTSQKVLSRRVLTDCQVWRFLPPATLLALLEVNSLFRRTLTAGEAKSIWTSVRKSCEAPDPLPGFNEIEWVRFLFGTKICHVSSSSWT